MQLDGPHAEQATAARSSLLLNAAACQLRMEDWHGAVARCHEVALSDVEQAETAPAAVRTVVIGTLMIGKISVAYMVRWPWPPCGLQAGTQQKI